MQTEETTTPPNKQVALDQMRAALEGKRGQQYWRTLDEVSQTEEFKTWFEDEFPNRSSIFEINRRDLLKFAGASLALAGLSGCRSVFLPDDKLVPYVKAPEDVISGKPLFYASAVMLAGYATGVLVEQFEGRPIKLEGNPAHPTSLGALDAISQAEILNFYDPDRGQAVIDKGDVSTWEAFYRAMATQLQAQVSTGGRDICVLVPTITSPTESWLLDRFRAKFPAAKFYSWEPCGRANVHNAVKAVTGSYGVPDYNFTDAKVIVSLDGDFLSRTDNPNALKYARQFAKGRRVNPEKKTMNRVYSVEATPGLVGAVADHRYPVKPSEVYSVACALANAVGVAAPTGSVPTMLVPDMGALLADLEANRGASVVVAGEHHGPEVHQLVFAINKALGNVGQTINFRESAEYTAGMGSVQELVAELDKGLTGVLMISNVNAVYNAPADVKIADAIGKAKLKIYHGQYEDETAALCDWYLPMAHSFEVWGDARSHDGTATVLQPVMAPLYEGRSSIEVWSALLGEPKGAYDLTRAFWKSKSLGGSDFEGTWRKVIHDGVVPNTSRGMLAMSAAPSGLPSPSVTTGLEAIFIADPSIFDGRYANNGWLQELPRPLTKVVWDNVVTLAPADALSLGVTSRDMVSVTVNGATVTGMVYEMPGHPVGSVTINLGYGRTAGGTIATTTDEFGGGFNSYMLRTSKAMTFAPVTITRTGETTHLATTQGHNPLGGDKIADSRDIIRSGTLAEYLEKGMSALQHGHSLSQAEIVENNLYPDEIFEWNGEKWGMTIDMNTCVGCNACVTACQAENNISVVGKEQVTKGREMHWIRIDRYYSGDDANPEVVWQPVACVHCESAPCEPVCPVAATVHSHEGLNQMVYNRCVGTRYCSNNCPYKVRRFNYLNFSDNQAQFSTEGQPWKTRTIPGPIKTPKKDGRDLLKLLNNPDVTVRGRGVMEKCTYCVQRINEARIEAKKGGRRIADGEVITACQQACPTESIVFGDITDKKSKVFASRLDPRGYLLLEELQTRPRTSHLAKLRNPNPNIKTTEKAEAHH